MNTYEQHLINDDFPIIMHLDTYGIKNYDGALSNWHENIEILYCVNGRGKVVISEALIYLEKGDIAIINSNKIHRSEVLDGVFQYYCFIIDTKFLKTLGLNIKNIEFEEFLTDSLVSDCLDKIIFEFKEKMPYYKSAIKGIIATLMTHIFRNYTRYENTTSSDDEIKKGIEFIHKNLFESISVTDVANAAGFSKSHFSRKFKAVTGYPINEYIKILRCYEAKAMLKEGKYIISEVSTACGFSDTSYFTKVFKKYTGCLPSKVKKE